jgi:dihydroneopterin aldolase/2-amino-4-hydroxy-6-hydroxymethyldihydropteridine diphosphokinase/dihydropteroate synthase/2-amino-4-hydroxy-6-hydroxymethyldihydropteridine diphosphokinase/dihydropteroate synthase
VTLYSSFEQCGRTDDITDTTNYAWVADELKKHVQNLKAKTIEFLSVSLCQWLLSNCPASIHKVKVQIDKPAAIKEAVCARVVVKRSRNNAVSTSSIEPIPSSSDTSIPDKSSFCSIGDSKHNVFTKSGLDFCGLPQLPLPTKSTKPLKTPSELCYIALGTNLGVRSRNIATAIDEIRALSNVRHVSFLYETPAAYVTDQPAFLNCVISVDTDLKPLPLLSALKAIEEKMGREPTFRFGPRIIDLDIIWMGEQVLVDEPELTIPHASMHERAFVLVPLLDICPSNQIHPKFRKSLADFASELPKKDISEVRRVIPIPIDQKREMCLLVDDKAPTTLMGILNATPDSFSDGRIHQNPLTVEETVESWIQLPKLHQIIIDIGGESTKPDAAPVPVQEELTRVLPVIAAVQKVCRDFTVDHQFPMSIDTQKLEVFEQAFSLGCGILNDVGAVSRFYRDRALHEAFALQVRKTKAVWVVMHGRGNSTTMNSLANYEVGHVTDSIASEMLPVIKSILEMGVLPWQIIVDPGVGFAKRGEQNVELLRNLSVMKDMLGHFPLLVGASRKRFMSTIIGREQDTPKSRDSAFLGIVSPLISAGTNILRVHDIAATNDARIAYEHIYK